MEPFRRSSCRSACLLTILSGPSRTELGNAVSAVRQADVLGLHVEVEAVVAAIASDAARLHAPEGRREMTVVLRIHPHHPRIHAVRHSQRAAHIAGPDVGGQAIV